MNFKILPILLIIGFISLSVFGILLMSHKSVGHNDCFASITNGGKCLASGSPLAFISFHFRAFQNLIWAIFIIALAVLLFSALRINQFADNSYFVNFSRTHFVPLNVSFLHWLTLHEKRDPALNF